MDETKENFCGACLAIPIAIAGSGLGIAGTTKGSHKRMKKILLISGISLTILSVFIAIYFLYIKKCNTCLAP